MKINPSTCIDLGLQEILVVQHAKYVEVKLTSNFVHVFGYITPLIDDTGCVELELEIGPSIRMWLACNLDDLEETLRQIRWADSIKENAAEPTPTPLRMCKYSLLELTGVVERGGETPGIANTIRELQTLITRLDPEWEVPLE